MLNILFIADVIGSPGRDVVRKLLPEIKRRQAIDLVVCNGENAAGGFGLTKDSASGLFAAGIDVLTGGNHIWDRKESLGYLREEARLVRPANLPPGVPGEGWRIFRAADGTAVGVINLLGRVFMKEADDPFRTVEVAHLAGMMAAEIGMDQRMAKRGGLLHDIGKAIDHDQEGTHPALGMEVATRYGEPQPVLEAIGYHHDDYAGGSLWPVLISAADAISGARPGARRESLEVYIKRLEALEKIANEFPGVEKSYAIQAGREIRIMVEHQKVDDARAQNLAGEIARRIERELEYPGQIRVTVIRETRAVDYAK